MTTLHLSESTESDLKADLHNLRLMHAAPAFGCVSTEIGNFSIFTHRTLLPRPQASNTACLNEP